MGIKGTSFSDFTLDAETILQDSAAQTASGVGEIATVAKQLDFGNVSPNSVVQVAYVRGQVVIDVSAVDTANADEVYDILLQLSDNVVFSAGTVVTKPLAHLGTALGTDGDAMTGTGRVVVGVDNEHQGTLFRHARLAFVIAGTTPSVTFQASLVRSY